MVFVDGDPSTIAAPMIGIDNAAIGRLAAEHLLARGARTIGLVTGPSD